MTEPAMRAVLGLFVASISVTTLWCQRGGAPQPTNLPASPVAAPIPTVSALVTGPGPMFESLMELKPGDSLSHFGYESREYFVSGMSNGEPLVKLVPVQKERKPRVPGRYKGQIWIGPDFEFTDEEITELFEGPL